MTKQITHIHTRWAPTSYKWSWNLYKWYYKWVTGVKTVVTKGYNSIYNWFLGPPCREPKRSRTCGEQQPCILLASSRANSWPRQTHQLVTVFRDELLVLRMVMVKVSIFGRWIFFIFTNPSHSSTGWWLTSLTWLRPFAPQEGTMAIHCLVGGFIWKICASQIGSFPHLGVKITNNWNQHLIAHLFVTISKVQSKTSNFDCDFDVSATSVPSDLRRLGGAATWRTFRPRKKQPRKSSIKHFRI